MNKELTELVFILDRSGSMSGMESDTVGGFNAMLEKQKQEAGHALVSTVLFDHECTVLHDRVPLEELQPMKLQDFTVRGCTALMDALGGAIHHIGNVHKYAREEDRPAHTVFVIMTDGMENASRRYSSDRVKQMVTLRKEQDGWEFLFLAANIDAVETAARYGIRKERSVTFEQDATAMHENFDAVSYCLSNVRSSKKIHDNWAAPIEAKFRRLHKK